MTASSASRLVKAYNNALQQLYILDAVQCRV